MAQRDQNAGLTVVKNESPTHSGPFLLITVDLEDWFQVENLRPLFPHSVWDRCEYRVERGTEELLGLFSRLNVRATFFVLGWVAEHSPGLVGRILGEGHEIASHGYRHELADRMDASRLSKDISRSKAVLEDATGVKVYGYRAPSFTLSERLLRILEECGMAYDSSLNDFRLHGRYGRVDLSRNGWHRLPGGLWRYGRVVELPVSNLPLPGGLVAPAGGGGYFRAAPLPLFRLAARRILRLRPYYMFYCHPWEFDPGQPRVKGISPLRRLRHYVNIHRNLERLERLLGGLIEEGAIPLVCRDYLREAGAVEESG